MSVTLPSSHPPASHWQELAESVLAEWLQHQPSSSLSVALAAHEYLIAGISEVLGKSGSTNLDLEDVRHVLRQASNAMAGCVDTAGPNRASDAAAQLIAQLANRGFHSSSAAGHLLLTIVSRSDASLSMDELTLILEALQQHLGQEWELTFGHGEEADLPTGLRLALLAAVSTES